ncbi:MAG TPA: tocopherol cyclase family protein [Anaerolineales bacterium]|nr:tocopherol cyclase family protein [Anaerolineales bacterium]
MKIFDMSLESAPTVTFNGWIEHHGDRYPVVDALGMLSHYWGRGLPKEWWWISANQFDSAGISVECTVLRSHVWGTKLHAPLGYLYYRNGTRSRLFISPPARITVAGSPDAFEARAASTGGAQITLKATGRDYGSLGDGIINTLVGDLELWDGDSLVAQARGTAALERRADAGKSSA